MREVSEPGQTRVRVWGCESGSHAPHLDGCASSEFLDAFLKLIVNSSVRGQASTAGPWRQGRGMGMKRCKGGAQEAHQH